MAKPLKKTIKKAPAKKTTPKSPHERGTLPSKGGKCKHSGPCFTVRLFKVIEGDYEGQDTFHWMDEAGAVMFAMRQSRDLELRAFVRGPDGKTIVVFEPRTYDVAASKHAFSNTNEMFALHREVWDQVHTARRESTKAVSNAATKKKVLKKR